MARAGRQTESDQDGGAPEWMVTFSDCMTLLLTFFVLLLSFSSFDDDRVFLHLKVIYSKAFTSITPISRIERDALFYLPPVKYINELDEGSETATSQEGPTDGLMKEIKMTDLNSSVAFLILSKKLFWARGSVLSPEGRRILDTMAPLLKSSPGRIVISEDGPTGSRGSEYLGLPRAWAVMEYLTKEQKLDSYRFSVSADAALARRNLGNGRARIERAVEIVLLQRSICN
jgi:chemotaxis protein MotB